MINKKLEMFINNTNLLIVCPNLYKKRILKEANSIKPISFITVEKLIDKLTYSYDENTIYEVMKQFNLVYDVAVCYLNNIRLTYLINKDVNKLADYEVNKVATINSITNFVTDNKLLIINNHFKEYIKQFTIIMIGYDDVIKKEDSILINDLNIKVIKEEEKLFIPKIITKCIDLEKELHYTFDSIYSLLDKVSIDKIYLCGINDRNYKKVKQISDAYNLPVNFLTTYQSMYDHEFVKKLFDDYLNNQKEFNNKYNKILNDEEIKLHNMFVEVMNSLKINYIDKFTKAIIINKLKSIYVKPRVKYKKAINVIDFDEIKMLKEDDYVFVIGFNQDKLLIMNKDDDYYKDSLKVKYGFSTSYDMNKNVMVSATKIINNAKNIYLSYSCYEEGKEMYPCSLVDDMRMEIKEFTKEYSDYSDDYNKYLLLRYKDDFIKYRAHNRSFARLLKTYQVDYQTYCNDYQKIDVINLHKYFKGIVKLSYSSMDSYNRCAFRYYVCNVLKVDYYEETFPIFIGNIYHFVLSKAFESKFDFDTVWSTYMDKNEYSFKIGEEYLLKRLKNELINIIKIINQQNEYINYKDALYEEKVKVLKKVRIDKDEVQFQFSGIIDKLMYKKIIDNDGRLVTLVSIIDYKTGNLDIKLDLVPYGLSLQLPVYLFLVNNSDKLGRAVLKGFFLQNILHDIPKLKPNEGKEAYEKACNDDMKLAGYIICDSNNLLPFDSTESNSLIIKSLKRNNNGNFSAYSRVKDDFEIEQLISNTTSIIDNVFLSIYDGDFMINPKVINGDNLGCKYCRFNDICYHRVENNIYIESSDDDAKMD